MSSMRALSAVTDTESDSMVIECTRVLSAFSASDGNRTNSLNGPGAGGTAGGSLHVVRFFVRTEAILQPAYDTGQVNTLM